MKYPFRTSFRIFTIVTLLLTGALAIAKALEDHGKLHAIVRDAKTGQPITRATVQIVETHQGAYTKHDSLGAIILNVAVGTYTVVAKYAEYEPDTARAVVIEADKTTELAFSLHPHVSNMMTRSQALVSKTKTDATMPGRQRADDIIRLTPGAVQDNANGGISYQGSRGTDNSTRVNGVEVNSALSKLAVSEVQVVTNAADVSYGNFSGNRGYPDRDATNTAEYTTFVENEYKEVHKEPLSTFSIDVDGASYSNIRRFISRGQMPPTDAVRVEEMVNYFKYEYPQPKNGDPFSITTELADCPWNKAHKLALIGLQGKEIAKADAPSANLTFLIDVSGSMMPEERLPLIIRAFKLLVSELRPQDKVAIVTYAGTPGLALPTTSGDKKDTILEALDRLESGGSTAGGAGLELAYKIAEQNFDKAKNNRVILATDGDFNVGISNTVELVKFIEAKRKTGIYLTTIGVGDDNYKDARMKELADKGNGNYYYIDNILEAKKVFITQMGGTLNTIADDVKIQIEFNPAQVKGYRLIGYESRILAKEDFNNDKKDAGELGSGHTVTALYEIIPPNAEGDELSSVDSLRYQHETPVVQATTTKSDEVMMVKLRYKKPGGEKSKLIEHPVTQTASTFADASNNFRFAASVAEFGMVLRDSKFKGEGSLSGALTLAKSAKGADEEGYRAECLKLIESCQLMDKAMK